MPVEVQSWPLPTVTLRDCNEGIWMEYSYDYPHGRRLEPVSRRLDFAMLDGPIYPVSLGMEAWDEVMLKILDMTGCAN